MAIYEIVLQDGRDDQFFIPDEGEDRFNVWIKEHSATISYLPFDIQRGRFSSYNQEMNDEIYSLFNLLEEITEPKDTERNLMVATGMIRYFKEYGNFRGTALF